MENPDNELPTLSIPDLYDRLLSYGELNLAAPIEELHKSKAAIIKYKHRNREAFYAMYGKAKLKFTFNDEGTKLCVTIQEPLVASQLPKNVRLITE